MKIRLLGLLTLVILYSCGQKGTIPVVGIGINGHEELLLSSEVLTDSIVSAMEQTQAVTLDQTQHELKFDSIVLGLGLETGFDARVIEIKNKNVFEFHYKEMSP